MDMDPRAASDSSSNSDQEWTRVEFSERERTPYSFAAAPSSSAKEHVKLSPGAFPEDDLPETTAFASGNSYPRNGPTSSPKAAKPSPAAQSDAQDGPDASSRPPPRPRTCRICLDVVWPTMETATMPSIPGLAPRLPRFVYKDPELGRLLSPCKCKGSSRYVHEECLKQWRMASPAQDRNYWHCPTCKYTYRLERLTWAKYVQSVPSQILLTLLVFAVALFAMGFVADPIINLYVDPWSIVGWGWSGAGPLEPIERIFDDDDTPGGWFEHFFKGMAGLGVLGFVKWWIASPLRWFRTSIGSGGARLSGRDRMENLSWIVILIGIATTLWGIYAAVRAFSRRVLMRTAEKVLDVGDDDDDDGGVQR